MTNVVAPAISRNCSWVFSDLKDMRNRLEVKINQLEKHGMELRELLEEMDHHVVEVDKLFDC